MNTMNRGEEGLGGIVWESDDGSTLPKHEESIYRDQRVIQLRISEHVLVDRDEDWSDIHLKSPQKVEEPKILKNKDRATNKNSQGGQVNPSSLKLGNDRALIQVNGNGYGLTRERIRQIEAKVLRRLQAPSALRHLGLFSEKKVLEV